MKHKKIKKLLPLVFSVMICTCPVSAANENIALLDGLQEVRTEEKGSIEIELTDGGIGTSKEGVVFDYAKVAGIEDGAYKLLDAYQESGTDLNAVETAEQLEEAAIRLSDYKVSDGNCVTDENGKAAIKDLDVGVYLLYASEQAKYDDITPLLIAIPTWGGTGRGYVVRRKSNPEAYTGSTGENCYGDPAGRAGWCKNRRQWNYLSLDRNIGNGVCCDGIGMDLSEKEETV